MNAETADATFIIAAAGPPSEPPPKTCPPIHVYAVEKDPATFRSDNLLQEISESKQYRWSSDFDPSLWYHNDNAGSCPVLILCAADLADACRALAKRGYAEDWPISFDLSDETIKTHQESGETAWPLTEAEEEAFTEWFRAAYENPAR